jgi:hypothetical protein
MFDPTDPARMALDGMESYCTAHPDSPSALRRPSLSLRNRLWIALLGPSMEEGIVGLGDSVEAALRAFDAQYNVRLRPPSASELSSFDAQRSRTRKFSERACRLRRREARR